MKKYALQKTYNGLKRLLITFFIIGFFFMLGYELWEDNRDEIEQRLVYTKLPDAPENLNIKAITIIKKKLEGRKNFRFIVLGDNQDNFRIFKRVLRKAAETNPDFIVNTGDFTPNGRYKQYMKLLGFLKETTTIPIIFVAGNHDFHNFGYRCFAHIFGPMNFSFNTGQYRFIFLDNVERRASSHIFAIPEEKYNYELPRGIDNGTINNLEVLLHDEKHNFIFMHIPPRIEPFSFYSFKKNSKTFVNLMTKYAEKVSGVFCGHIHGYGETTLNGVTYIVSGAAGMKLHDKHNGIINRFHFVQVDVTGVTVTHRVHFVD